MSPRNRCAFACGNEARCNEWRIFSPHRRKTLGAGARGIDGARHTYLRGGHREARGAYSFECGRCNRTGRTRNAVSWKLGQRVFGLDRDSGNRGAAEGRKRKERENGGERKRGMQRKREKLVVQESAEGERERERV